MLAASSFAKISSELCAEARDGMKDVAALQDNQFAGVSQEGRPAISQPSSQGRPSLLMGQKRRFSDVHVTSALTPKTDIHRKGRHV
jgi:hypothetical protein